MQNASTVLYPPLHPSCVENLCYSACQRGLEQQPNSWQQKQIYLCEEDTRVKWDCGGSRWPTAWHGTSVIAPSVQQGRDHGMNLRTWWGQNQNVCVLPVCFHLNVSSERWKERTHISFWSENYLLNRMISRWMLNSFSDGYSTLLMS